MHIAYRILIVREPARSLMHPPPRTLWNLVCGGFRGCWFHFCPVTRPEIGTSWPKWPVLAKMVPKWDELISAYFLLVLGWNIMKNIDFENFGQFDPISGHFGPVYPAGPILPIFKIEHFVIFFSMILGWKIWKNVFFIINRLFLDDFGPNGPIGPTAPK